MVIFVTTFEKSGEISELQLACSCSVFVPREPSSSLDKLIHTFNVLTVSVSYGRKYDEEDKA